MSEKLTKLWLQNELDAQTGWGHIRGSVRVNGDALFARIESDREAIRAETREEILKDHFKNGEIVWARKKDNSGRVYDFEKGFFVVAIGDPCGSITELEIIRPLKMRPVAELLNAIYAKWYPGPVADGCFDSVRNLPESIIRMIAHREGISTKCPE